MKKSFVASRRGASALKRSALRSASSCGSRPCAFGRVGHRLAVLVGAGEEEDVLAALAMVARHHVGGDRRVRVPQMGRRVDVVDRRGDVEGARGGHDSDVTRRRPGPAALGDAGAAPETPRLGSRRLDTEHRTASRSPGADAARSPPSRQARTATRRDGRVGGPRQAPRARRPAPGGVAGASGGGSGGRERRAPATGRSRRQAERGDPRRGAPRKSVSGLEVAEAAGRARARRGAGVRPARRGRRAVAAADARRPGARRGARGRGGWRRADRSARDTPSPRRGTAPA